MVGDGTENQEDQVLEDTEYHFKELESGLSVGSY